MMEVRWPIQPCKKRLTVRNSIFHLLIPPPTPSFSNYWKVCCDWWILPRIISSCTEYSQEMYFEKYTNCWPGHANAVPEKDADSCASSAYSIEGHNRILIVRNQKLFFSTTCCEQLLLHLSITTFYSVTM